MNNKRDANDKHVRWAYWQTARIHLELAHSPQ